MFNISIHVINTISTLYLTKNALIQPMTHAVTTSDTDNV